MRKLVAVIAGGLFWLSWQAVLLSPVEAAVSVNGQVRLNVIYSDRIYGAGQTIAPTDLPFASGPAAVKERDNNQTNIDARRSRINVSSSDDAPGNIKLSSLIQVDFDTTDGNALTSNSRHPRLRLAYGQAALPNGVTVRAGQVRTILSEFGDNLIGGVAAPDVINENGHFDQLQARQPGLQVAWTGKMGGGNMTIGAAVEKQAVSAKSRTGFSAVVDERQGEAQDMPLIGAGVRYLSPLFAVFARGGFARAKVILTGGKDVDETVSLLAIGAEVKPIPTLTLHGQFWVSNGLGRINGAFNDVALVSGKLEAVEANAFNVGAQFRVTPELRFNAVYQWMKADDDPKIFDLSATSTDKEQFQALNVNFIYRFWKNWDTGVEYMRGKVESFGASDGTINIINFRLFYYF